jgi:membrane protease YdiL (CAAX protease family)
VIGAVGAALIPNARRLNGRVIAVLVTTAAVNSIGEELLWRGLFVDEFRDDPVLGVWWPMIGFSLWHLAPQSILPSSFGRWRFVGGAALVGLGAAVTAWRGGGLRHTLVPHLATDACGIRAAEFRLGR